MLALRHYGKAHVSVYPGKYGAISLVVDLTFATNGPLLQAAEVQDTQLSSLSCHGITRAAGDFL